MNQLFLNEKKSITSLLFISNYNYNYNTFNFTMGGFVFNSTLPIDKTLDQIQKIIKKQSKLFCSRCKQQTTGLINQFKSKKDSKKKLSGLCQQLLKNKVICLDCKQKIQKAQAALNKDKSEHPKAQIKQDQAISCIREPSNKAQDSVENAQIFKKAALFDLIKKTLQQIFKSSMFQSDIAPQYGQAIPRHADNLHPARKQFNKKSIQNQWRKSQSPFKVSQTKHTNQQQQELKRKNLDLQNCVQKLMHQADLSKKNQQGRIQYLRNLQGQLEKQRLNSNAVYKQLNDKKQLLSKQKSETQKLNKLLKENQNKIYEMNSLIATKQRQLDELNKKYLYSQRQLDHQKKKSLYLTEKITEFQNAYAKQKQELDQKQKAIRKQQAHLRNITNHRQKLITQSDQLKRNQARILGQNKKLIQQIKAQKSFLKNCQLQGLQWNHKNNLSQMVTQCFGKRIKNTHILYRFDAKNPTNFHKYIDGHKNILLIYKTKGLNSIFAGSLALGTLIPNQNLTQDSFLFSLSSNKYFTRKPDNHNYKSICYDQNYFIIGNSELRIKHKVPQVYSNFGTMMGYYNAEGCNNDVFVSSSEQRKSELEGYQIYSVQFE